MLLEDALEAIPTFVKSTGQRQRSEVVGGKLAQGKLEAKAKRRNKNKKNKKKHKNNLEPQTYVM